MNQDRNKLLSKIAYLYYIENLNQSQIAAKLGIYRTSISRMLTEARNAGIVKIEIENFDTNMFKLENYVKGNFLGYITLNKGDYKLAQQYYGAHGQNYVNQLYPTTLYKDIKFKEFRKEEKWINIQIGNSANPSNNHYEILDKLFKVKDNKEIKIFCILSYGGTKKYVKSVIEYGNKLFGKNFIPIVEFMTFEEYLKYVNNIDIVIFAHKRQQGVGNLIAFLSMKKTIVLRSDVTTYESYLENGIKVKSFENLDNLDKFDEKILEHNKEIAKKIYSLEEFTKSWEEIFNHIDENEETYEK